MDFTANKFHVILFSLFEALFTIFTLFVLANRPLFAATKLCKSAQKYLSTKLEIKSKQILTAPQISNALLEGIGPIGHLHAKDFLNLGLVEHRV